MNKDFESRFKLRGKTAVVTGGLGIIGKRFGRGLSQAGCNLAIIDFKPDDDSYAKELSAAFDTDVIAVQGDVSCPESVSSMKDSVVDHFGSIDILLNNAASKSDNLDAFFAPFEDYSIEEWKISPL